MGNFKTFEGRVVRSVALSEFTKHIELEVSGVSHFGFVPGQWLSVKAQTPDGEEMIRAYSIASPPAENGHIAFCLNRVEEGFMSNYLFNLNEGGQVNFQGPFGSFTLRPPLRDTVFIATGTGIAPFRSMLQWLFADQNNSQERHQDREFWLLFGARTEQDLYYHEEFEQLAAKHPNFHFLPTLSRAPEEWKGLRGYVQQHLGEIVGMRTDMHAYICGLDKMVKANRELLKGLGWDRTGIRYEKYD